MYPIRPGACGLAGYFLFGIIALSILPPRSATAMDHSPFGELLGKYVKGGVVDYQGFKKDKTVLYEYLDLINKTDIAALSRNEQLAFYINAYNAGTISLILEKYPDISSIRDIGNRFFNSPFKKKFLEIGNQKVSLDHIENDILRPRFADPRIHFAINCASKSCPPLMSVPYHGAAVERQLDEAAREFINDKRFNRLEGNTLYLSRIFKWFSGDFDNDPFSFFLKYASVDLRKRLETRGPLIKIKYLDYDWALNGK